MLLAKLLNMNIWQANFKFKTTGHHHVVLDLLDLVTVNNSPLVTELGGSVGVLTHPSLARVHQVKIVLY